MWLALALVLAVLWRRPTLFALVLSAYAAADLTALGLKHAVGRPRPPVRPAGPEPLVGVPDNPSFPSGHAATSFACGLVLAWAAPRLAVPLLLLATAIAFSRVYVGVHYPLDAVGGAALGLLVATALRWLAGALRRSRRARRGG